MSQNESKFGLEAGPAIDRQLDDLIAQWTVKNHLSAGQAETIRKNILNSSAELPFEWWWNLFKSVGLVEKEHEENFFGTAYNNTTLTNIFKQIIPNWSGSCSNASGFMPCLSFNANY